MGFFQKLKERLGRTQDRLVHEIRRIVSRSPRLTAQSAEELEACLLSADFGVPTTPVSYTHLTLPTIYSV